MKHVAIVALALIGLVEVVARGLITFALVCTIVGIIVVIELSDNKHPLFGSYAFDLARDLARV